ncbi:hypothetical protein M3Y98_00999100 [Aphelenchoides besseyi]|nr:hypothetical protein M3Y98_00999100 [Aphelenchoides besseyi]
MPPARRGKFAKANRAVDQYSIKNFFKPDVKRKTPAADTTDSPLLKSKKPEVITLDGTPVTSIAACPVSIGHQDAVPFGDITNTLNKMEPSDAVLDDSSSSSLTDSDIDAILFNDNELTSTDAACTTYAGIAIGTTNCSTIARQKCQEVRTLALRQEHRNQRRSSSSTTCLRVSSL